LTLSSDKKEQADRIDLNDVMLTMDVADTLRYQEQLIERELSAADMDRALIDKVRRMYEAQGIEVSEQIIAEAVAALREERFTYKPPDKDANTALARLYVKRGFWTKTVLITLALLFCGVMAYQWFVTGPAKRRQTQASRAIETTWAQFRKSRPAASITAAGQARYAAAKKALAKGDIETAATETKALELLATLPVQLDNGHKQSLAAAKEKRAREIANDHYEKGRTALERGNIEAAATAAKDLAHLETVLQAEYRLNIVSRPNESSGAIRIPPNNRLAQNYYIIVEAMTPDGEKVTVPITSEEDGEKRVVSKWGFRVAKDDYDRVRRDKMDDGIIQNNLFGVKKKGRLSFEYMIPTTGAAILEW